jgi:hypothetical protein
MRMRMSLMSDGCLQAILMVETAGGLNSARPGGAREGLGDPEAEGMSG